MKHYEIKSEENYTKVIFHDSLIIFIDIDILFRETNINFAKSLQDMSMDISFDFNQRYNKNMYTHSFLQVICEHIKTQDNNYKLCFYSNNLTKDKFRNILLKKLKTIFGFKVYEDIIDFSEIINKIQNRDCNLIPHLEVLFRRDNKPKTFKHIKKYMIKNGLNFLNDEFFEDVSNKIAIMG